LFFATGKQLIGIYLGKVSFSSTYGAAGSLVLVLVWVYYSAQVIFFGAEFTKIYTRTFGSQFSRQFQPGPADINRVIVNPPANTPVRTAFRHH
jgi:uncharacterized BrkB/YihY/UPF0761 family membrane protein